MNPTPESPVTKITRHLPLLEKILLAALIIGIILTIFHIDRTVVTIASLGLGIVFFLYAYKPVEMVREENELLGFDDLLATTIVPKVLWISAAVSALGLMFWWANLGGNGYRRMLLIGGSTSAIGIVLIAVFLFMGVKHVKAAMPVLVRAIPLLLLDVYTLFR